MNTVTRRGRHLHRCRTAVSPVEFRSAESPIADVGLWDIAVGSPEDSRSWRRLLRRDDRVVVEDQQPEVQPFKYLNSRFPLRGELQGMPAVPQRAVPGAPPRVLVADDPVELDVGTERTLNGFRLAGR